jgi:signal transduction histidine kinase
MHNKEEKWVKYGKLLSGLIHNLNTPLMGVSGRVEILQIKLGEDKGLVQIANQVERINEMLSAVAYLVDKDQYDKVTDIDIGAFLKNYFNFLYSDMRFKHHINKEVEFTSCKLNINPADLLFVLHTTVDHLLDHSNNDSVLTAHNPEGGTIEIKMKGEFPGDILDNLNAKRTEKFSADMNSNYKIDSNISDNTVSINITVTGL